MPLQTNVNVPTVDCLCLFIPAVFFCYGIAGFGE